MHRASRAINRKALHNTYLYICIDAILTTDFNAQYFVYTGVCLCYFKQPCKSYKLFNKHNKGVELSDVISAENLYNVQSRAVKGI